MKGAVLALVLIMLIGIRVYVSVGKVKVKMELNPPKEIFVQDTETSIKRILPKTKIAPINQDVYDSITVADDFYSVFHSARRQVVILYSPENIHSADFVKSIKAKLTRPPYDTKFDYKLVELKTLKDSAGSIYLLKNCESFCVIDNKVKKIYVPHIYTGVRKVNNITKAFAFIEAFN